MDHLLSSPPICSGRNGLVPSGGPLTGYDVFDKFSSCELSGGRGSRSRASSLGRCDMITHSSSASLESPPLGGHSGTATSRGDGVVSVGQAVGTRARDGPMSSGETSEAAGVQELWDEGGNRVLGVTNARLPITEVWKLSITGVWCVCSEHRETRKNTRKRGRKSEIAERDTVGGARRFSKIHLIPSVHYLPNSRSS